MNVATATTPWDMTDATAQAVCDFEDGDTAAVAAFLKVATDAEKACFTEEADLIIAKRARAFQARQADRRAKGGSPLAARNAAAELASGPDYEGRILARDERDWTWWT